MRSWDIGTRADCDVVVDSPLVSARHCQLTQTADGYYLNDLGSTNGTYVNGLRINTPTRLGPGASITLGKTMPMPWPPELVRFVQIGRLADNDVVVDDKRVSGHHAQLVIIEGFEIRIEDHGSSNGTFLNSTDRRLTGPTAITVSDTLYFGTLGYPVARLLAESRERKISAPAVAPPSAAEPGPAEPFTARPAISDRKEYLWLAAWLGQGPILAILIVLIFGRHAATAITEANWGSVAQGIASATFTLALAAIWLGFTLAAGEAMVGRSSSGLASPGGLFDSIGLRLVVFVSLCAVACSLLLAIVYWGSGLDGPWLAMWGVVFMSCLIGLFFGRVVFASFPTWATATAILLTSFGLMCVLGGCFWTLPHMAPPFALASAATPSRWAFEALLLLDAAEHPAPTINEGSDSKQSADLVEPYFPAAAWRMGPKADAIALGLMLIGLVAVSAIISGRSDPGR
jgi:FHA domain